MKQIKSTWHKQILVAKNQYTTIEEQKRPITQIIHLFMLVAWDHQGDWTNRELTYVCFWKRKAQNISAFSLLSQLFSKINKKYFSMIGKIFYQTFAWLFSSKHLLFAKWTFQVNHKMAFFRFTMLFFQFWNIKFDA